MLVALWIIICLCCLAIGFFWPAETPARPKLKRFLFWAAAFGTAWCFVTLVIYFWATPSGIGDPTYGILCAIGRLGTFLVASAAAMAYLYRPGTT